MFKVARKPRRVLAGLVLALLASWSGMVGAQTVVRPGFNLFSEQQDVQVGKESASRVEQQLPLLRDATANSYLTRLGQRLAAQAPGPRFPYTFRIVNLSDVNAFALPGGFVYVHRGLIERVRTEGELAGVVAHEIAHVALRHGTNQASRAYIANAGLGALGTLLGERSQGTTGSIVRAIGGFGLNAVFLRYSRKAETQADIVGTQIMARAGYDPLEMARFFNRLRQEAGGEPSKLSRFLSDHPSYGDREARVRREAQLIQARRAPPVGDIRIVQSTLRRYPPAPTLQQLSSRQGYSSEVARR